MDLKTKRGVEVFSAGVWNGDEYSIKDLDEMVRAFNDHPRQRPPLKLGHDDKQVLLQRDGMPAAGWIGNLYRKGTKLIADFIDIPEKIYKLLERGAYKKVSAEVFWNAKIGENTYRRALAAVALLGADMPGVTNLDDIFEMYTFEGGELHHYDLDRKSFTIEIDKQDLGKQENEMTEAEKIAKLEAQLAEATKNYSALEKDSKSKVEKMETDLAEIKKNYASVQEREKAAADEAAKAKLDATVTELVSEKLVTPAMKPYVRALLGEEKKEYTLTPKGSDEAKKFSKAELLKEVLKLHSIKSKVSGEERSEDGVDAEGEEQQDDQQVLEEKITKYISEHPKASYKDAYKVVCRDIDYDGDAAEDGEELVDEDED